MNYKIHLQVLGVVLGLAAATAAQAAVVLVDNFDEYSGGNSTINITPTIGSAVQTNPGGASGIAGAWTRFGAATSAGIISINSPSASGLAAQYSLNWVGGTNGTIRYNFATPQDLSLLSAVSIDLSLNSSLANTMVTVQLSNGTTTWALTTPVSFTNTSFTTFTFDVSNVANMTRTDGSASYAATLGSVASVSFRFTNTVQTTGSQQVYFDNLNVVTVPEPSTATAAALGLTGLMFAGRRFAGRRNR
jgi:hypothetical protein